MCTIKIVQYQALYILLIKLELSHQQYIAMWWLCYYLYIVAGVMFIVGYQANFIQLGLDQLLEVPSEYLGFFVPWAKWIIATMLQP